MDAQLLFVFIILTLILFFENVIVFVGCIFWFPYILNLKLKLILFVIVAKLSLARLRKMNLGYIYKFYSKVLVMLTVLMEKEREALAMKGVRFDKPHDYVCKCDAEAKEDEKTVFSVRFLTAKEQAKIRDYMYNVSGMGATRSEKFLTGSAALKSLELGVLGWKNFLYEDGEEILFTEDNVSCIPPAERDELASYIRGIDESEI